MKNRLFLILYKLLLKLNLFYGKFIKKCRMRLLSAVFRKIYIKTFSLFDENKLNTNIELSIAVRNRLFELEDTEKSNDLNEDQVNKLLEIFENDEWTKETISNFYLLQAHFYQNGPLAEHFQEDIDELIKKAKKNFEDAKPIENSKKAEKINKNIKREMKLFQKEIRRRNSLKIEKEKMKFIKPIPIKYQHVVYVISLFSTLFLISGFAYNKFFFGHFNIEVGAFFGISDYVASSIDNVISAVISTTIFAGSMGWGLTNRINKIIHADQFDLKESSNRDYFMVFIILGISSLLVWHSFVFRELQVQLLSVLVLFLSFEMLLGLSLWEYVENQLSAKATVMALIIFSIILGGSMWMKIKTLENGKFISPFIVELQKEYEKYSESEIQLISGNLNYFFFWETDGERILILPKSGIKSIHSKKSDNEYSPFEMLFILYDALFFDRYSTKIQNENVQSGKGNG